MTRPTYTDRRMVIHGSGFPPGVIAQLHYVATPRPRLTGDSAHDGNVTAKVIELSNPTRRERITSMPGAGQIRCFE